MLVESIIAVIILGICGLFGVILIPIMQRYPRAYDNLSHFLISLAAGCLISDAVLHLIPEALEYEEKDSSSVRLHHLFVGLCVILGIWIFTTFDRIAGHSHSHDNELPLEQSENRKFRHVAYMILSADGLHNVFDGLAISISFSKSFGSGIATCIAVFGHEIPHELSDVVILIEHGMSKWTALAAHTAVQFTALIGVIIGYFVAEESDNVVKYLLGFTAGNFLYLGLTILLPYSKQRLNMKESKSRFIILEQLGLLSGFALLTGLIFAE
eukprot:NODE_1104_length_1137_cov_0.331407.p1 type:complete len:269 gc:universal NODE_1104_length_1137_cov_0.331407:173-979(+)